MKKLVTLLLTAVAVLILPLDTVSARGGGRGGRGGSRGGRGVGGGSRAPTPKAGGQSRGKSKNITEQQRERDRNENRAGLIWDARGDSH